MRPERCHGTMNQRPAAVDSSRQECGVLVIRRHDDAVSFEGAEVFGQSQRHSGPAARIGRVGNDVLLQFRNKGDARIFNAPDLFRIILRVWASKLARDRFAIHRLRCESARRKDATGRADLPRGKAAGSCHPRAALRLR